MMRFGNYPFVGGTQPNKLTMPPAPVFLPDTLLPGMARSSHTMVAENVRKYHMGSVVTPDHRPSTSASAAFASGSHNVISMARYRSMAVFSSARASARRPIAA
jgi:hypothetical protein